MAGVLVAGLLAWGSIEYARTVELTARYAAVIAACANGGAFAVGETLVLCHAERVVTF